MCIDIGGTQLHAGGRFVAFICQGKPGKFVDVKVVELVRAYGNLLMC